MAKCQALILMVGGGNRDNHRKNVPKQKECG